MKVILQMVRRLGGWRRDRPLPRADGFEEVGPMAHFAYKSVPLGVNTRYFPKIST